MKSTRIVLCSSVLLLLQSLANLANAGYKDEVLADDPLAYWRLDDADIDAESLADGFGEYHEDTIQQVPGLIASDPDNTAARFEGFTDEDTTGIHIMDFDGFNTGGPFEEKTVTLWFQADDVDTDNEQVLFESGGSTRGINMYIQGGQAFVGAWNRGANDGIGSPWESGDDDPEGGNLYLSTPVQSGEIYQLTMVMAGEESDDLEGTLTGYLNGEQFGQKTGVGLLYNHGDDAGIGHVHQNTFFQSGNWNNGNGMYFTGVIDELAYYNSALSGDRIAALYAAAGGAPGLPGDFNGNGELDAGDIDELSARIQAGDNVASFDLSGDGVVNIDDLTAWVKDVRKTWFGDSNLDGEFNSSDFVQVFTAGLFETEAAATWETGDWNGDGVFDSSDFVTSFTDGGFEVGPLATNAVPEPTGVIGLLIGLVVLCRKRN